MKRFILLPVIELHLKVRGEYKIELYQKGHNKLKFRPLFNI